MKQVWLILILTGFGFRLTAAETNEVDWGAVMDTAQQWAQDNLDDEVLQALPQIDRKTAEDFLRQSESYLRSNDVLDLSQLKPAAQVVLPLLDAHEETRDYAAWLRSRMDYFDTADDLEKAQPPPKVQPGKPIPPRPNPSFKATKEIWVQKVAPRPWPKNATAMVPQLKPIFAAEHVPTELVWMAEVESGFDPRARSPVGATGMFQLMPETARNEGLSLWPFDERKQIEPAAHAAAQYLHHLYEKFGNWRLAVAAYNCGEGTVRRQLQRRKATRYEQIATALPAETQLYVPKVEATVLHREGVSLEQLTVPETTPTSARKTVTVEPTSSR